MHKLLSVFLALTLVFFTGCLNNIKLPAGSSQSQESLSSEEPVSSEQPVSEDGEYILNWEEYVAASDAQSGPVQQEEQLQIDPPAEASLPEPESLPAAESEASVLAMDTPVVPDTPAPEPAAFSAPAASTPMQTAPVPNTPVQTAASTQTTPVFAPVLSAEPTGTYRTASFKTMQFEYNDQYTLSNDGVNVALTFNKQLAVVSIMAVDISSTGHLGKEGLKYALDHYLTGAQTDSLATGSYSTDSFVGRSATCLMNLNGTWRNVSIVVFSDDFYCYYVTYLAGQVTDQNHPEYRQEYGKLLKSITLS